MFLEDAMDNRQPDSRTLEFLFPVQVLEYLEQFVGISHFKSDAVVADEDHGLIPIAEFTDFYDRFFAVPRKFRCVGE